MEPTNSIEVEGLVREFKKGPRAVDGIDLRVEPGEIYGFLGPNGAGKSTTVLMLTTLLPPTAGTARVGGYDVVKEGPKVRSVIGAALQEAALDPMLTGRDHLRLQSTLQGISRARAQAALAGAARPRRPERGGRSQGRRLLRRDEAPARSGARARAPAADPLPRRADDGARHPEPHRPLGRGRAPRPRGRRDRLPDHPVPRGGGRARRPGRDHRPRAHRRRGNADGAQGRDRAAERARDPRERSRSRAARRRARSLRRGARHGLRAKSPSGCARGSPGSRPSSARSTTPASLSPAWRSRRPRSTMSSSPRPAGRWRAPREAEAGRSRAGSVTGRLAADRSARVALGRPHEPPAGGGRLPSDLPDDAPARELGRAASRRRSSPASRPTPFSRSRSPSPSSRARSSRR